MDDDETPPRPFRRERNLSNRNFRRRSSNRSFGTDIQNQTFGTQNSSFVNEKKLLTASRLDTSSNELESAFKQKVLLKIDQDEKPQVELNNHVDDPMSPDPALMGFQQKLLRFETLKDDEPIIFKIAKFKSKDNNATLNVTSSYATPTTPTTPPSLPQSSPPLIRAIPQSSSLYKSMKSVNSEDVVDHIDSDSDSTPCDEYSLSTHIDRDIGFFVDESTHDVPHEMLKLKIDDFSKEPQSVDAVLSSRDSSAMVDIETNNLDLSDDMASKKNNKDFPRNYRSTPRPKTELVATTNRRLINKYSSLRDPRNDEDAVDDEEVELRDIHYKNIQPILDELINSESSYVDSLFNGIKNYGNIFERQDLPIGLRGKKYVLLGNIEQIAEFHRDEFLPMLERNRRNLKSLFDEFQQLVEQNCFYGYVIFTMNKQKSLKLCDEFKNYFKILQTELNDKLGINSFLVQPIQRIAKYPLLLKEFISALFENRETIMKPLIESCCRLDKKIRTLLTTTNESEVVNDIVDCHEFNVFYQGKFRKVSEFNVFDYTLKRSYRSKVFIFDKCIIYTEIKGKHLVFHGRYPCEHIGIVAKTKSFTLFYQKRKQQECDFNGEAPLIEMWMELIREMVSAFASEERRKLQELYSRESDHMHRMPPNLSLFRDSNRFSSDSGIGNIWVMPKPEVAEDSLSNRSTWYAVS